MEPNDNRYSAGWNRHNPNDLPTHDSRGFRIRPGPRCPVLNANVPMIRDWYNQYLEVEDARPGKEQGQMDLLGILAVLIQHIFHFLTKKIFLLFQRVSRSAKNAVDNSRGLLFDAYQERLGELCKEVSRRPIWGRDQGLPGNIQNYNCKIRVSIGLELGDNIRSNGYVVQVTAYNYNVTNIREETMFLVEPIIEEAMNASVLYVCPYTGEVVEHFSPPPQV